MSKQKIDYSLMPESDVIIKYTIQRFHKGLYSLILVTGLPGTGKSSTSQRYAELIYEVDGNKKFKADDVVDSLLQLLRRIKKIKKAGEIIVIEEVSVLFPSRRAMSRDNVDIARILDTIRKKRVILISNAPIFKTIDSHFRSMANILVETIRINKTSKVVVSKAWKLQTNPGSGKTYKHTFTRNGLDVKRMFTYAPNKDTWELYEQKKDDFMDKLYDRLEIEAESREKKLDKKKPLVLDVESLTEQQREVYELCIKQKIEQKQVAKRLGVVPSQISKVVKRLRELSGKSLGKSGKSGD